MNQDNFILKVTNLTVKIQNQMLIDHLSFRVRKATTLAILGPNGAGKTVLLRALLNRVPYTGQIEWTEKVKIGYVPQYVTVADVPMSVREFLSNGNGADVEKSPRTGTANRQKHPKQASRGALRRATAASPHCLGTKRQP